MSGTTFDVEAIAAANGAVIAYPDRAVIYMKGETGDCAYIVKSGKVEIRGAGQTIETIGVGEIFGEMALIDGDTHSASAVAVGPVELLAIDRDLFDALIRDDYEFALAVMHLLARRLRAAVAMLKPLEEMPKVERSGRAG